MGDTPVRNFVCNSAYFYLISMNPPWRQRREDPMIQRKQTQQIAGKGVGRRRIGRIRALFQGCSFLYEFPGIAGIPIKFHHVNFQEFSSILKGILLQARKENAWPAFDIVGRKFRIEDKARRNRGGGNRISTLAAPARNLIGWGPSIC